MKKLFILFEDLHGYQINLLRQVDDKFYRSVYHKIDWSNRMIGLKGSRGTGKTTIMLQQIKYHLNKTQNRNFTCFSWYR